MDPPEGLKEEIPFWKSSCSGAICEKKIGGSILTTQPPPQLMYLWPVEVRLVIKTWTCFVGQCCQAFTALAGILATSSSHGSGKPLPHVNETYRIFFESYPD